MVRDIENCKLQIANCKLIKLANASDCGRAIGFQLPIFNFQFSICNFQSSRRRGFHARRGPGGDRHHRPAGRAAPAGHQRGAAKAKIARIKMEMTQLMAAIEDVRTEARRRPISARRNQPRPTPCNSCKAAFPRCPAVELSRGQFTTADSVYNPATALVFWLGGAQDAAGDFIGFSANPQNPFDASASRIAPPSISAMRQQSGFPPQQCPQVLLISRHGSPRRRPSGVIWNLYQFFPQNDLALGTVGALPVFQGRGRGIHNDSLFDHLHAAPPNRDLALCRFDGEAPTDERGFHQSQDVTNSSVPEWTASTVSHVGANWPHYPAGTNYDPTNGLDDMTNFTNGATVGDDTQ